MSQPTSDPGRKSSTPRVLVRNPEDYDNVTQPSFHVNYSDGNEEKNDKLRKNPLVPISAAATAAILAGGLYQFKRGNAVWSQRLMRARVFAQGTTLALLAGSVYQVKAGAEQERTNVDSAAAASSDGALAHSSGGL